MGRVTIHFSLGLLAEFANKLPHDKPKPAALQLLVTCNFYRCHVVKEQNGSRGTVFPSRVQLDVAVPRRIYVFYALPPG